MAFSRFRCKKCDHTWFSDWPWRMSPSTMECSKCGAKGRDIKLVPKRDEK